MSEKRIRGGCEVPIIIVDPDRIIGEGMAALPEGVLPKMVRNLTARLLNSPNPRARDVGRLVTALTSSLLSLPDDVLTPQDKVRYLHALYATRVYDIYGNAGLRASANMRPVFNMLPKAFKMDKQTGLVETMLDVTKLTPAQRRLVKKDIAQRVDAGIPEAEIFGDSPNHVRTIVHIDDLLSDRRGIFVLDDLQKELVKRTQDAYGNIVITAYLAAPPDERGTWARALVQLASPNAPAYVGRVVGAVRRGGARFAPPEEAIKRRIRQVFGENNVLFRPETRPETTLGEVAQEARFEELPAYALPTHRGVLEERAFPSATEGLLRGYQYLDPWRAFYYRATELYNLAGDLAIRTELKRYGTPAKLVSRGVGTLERKGQVPVYKETEPLLETREAIEPSEAATLGTYGSRLVGERLESIYGSNIPFVNDAHLFVRKAKAVPDYWFPKEVADFIDSWYRKGPGRVLGTASTISGAIKFAQTGFDAALMHLPATGLTDLMSLQHGRVPKASAAYLKGFFKSLINPDAWMDYLRSRADILEKYQLEIPELRSSEQYSVLSRGRTVIPKTIPGALFHKLIDPIIGRFASAFELGQDMVLLEYFKALDDIAPNLSPQERAAHGVIARGTTGNFSLRRAGIHPLTWGSQTSLLWYSSRYIYSTLSLLNAAFHSSAPLRVVWPALARYTGAWMMATAALNSLLSAAQKDEDLKHSIPGLSGVKIDSLIPGNPAFGGIVVKLPTGETVLGLPRSLEEARQVALGQKLPFRQTKSMVFTPAGVYANWLRLLGIIGYAAVQPDLREGDLLSFAKTSGEELLQTYANRLGPPARLAMDTITGRTPVGYPFDPLSLHGLLYLGTNEFSPFWVQSILEGLTPLLPDDRIRESNTSVAIEALSSFLGFNPRRYPDRVELDRYLREQKFADGTQRFPDGLATVPTAENGLREFMLVDPKARTLFEALTGRALSRVGEAKEARMIQEQAAADELAAFKQYREGEISSAQLRERLNGIAVNVVRKQRELGGPPEPYFRGPPEERKALDLYFTEVFEKSRIPGTGTVDGVLLEKRERKFFREHPELEWIQDRIPRAYTLDGVRFKTAQNAVERSGYFDLEDAAWADTQETFPEARSYEFAEEYLAARRPEGLESSAFTEGVSPEESARRSEEEIRFRTDPILTYYDNRLQIYRLEWLWDHPDVAQLLDMLGINPLSRGELGAISYTK